MTDKIIKILIVDDHLVVRKGFKTFLKVFDDLELVGQADNGEAAIRESIRLQPDVVLMDLIMPDINGVVAIRRIREQDRSIQFIAMTSFTEKQELVQQALESGALGYLYKNISIDELANAIRAVHAKRPVLAPRAMQALIQSKHSARISLTEREKDVLQLLAKGLRNQDIAIRLNLSEATIKYHMSNIFKKLQVDNRTEALAVAYEQNLLDGLD